MNIALPDALKIDLLDSLSRTTSALHQCWADLKMVLVRKEILHGRLDDLELEGELLSAMRDSHETGIFRPSPVIEKVESMQRLNEAEREGRLGADTSPSNEPLALDMSGMLLRIVEHYRTAATAHALPVVLPSLDRVVEFANETRDGMSFDKAANILVPVMRNALLGNADLWAGITH